MVMFFTKNVVQAVPYQGQKAIISAFNQEAVDEAKLLIPEGANVVDLAVATALNLSVTAPFYASLGGGGFALIGMGKEVIAIDFREVAPLATGPDFYLNKSSKASLEGGSAVAVPGIPAGLFEMHKKFGKLPWSKLFQGAIKLAQKGFRVSGEWVEMTEETKSIFNESGKKRFFKSDGSSYLPGDLLIQKDLGELLIQFQEFGSKGFYEGEGARDLVDSVKKAGGVLSLEDLEKYKVRWLKPLETSFNGFDIFLMPPPSSGGVVMTIALNLMEQLKLKNVPSFSTQEFHLIGEILSRSFRGRSLLGDPDFHQNPVTTLTSISTIKELAKSIRRDRATHIKPLTSTPQNEGGNTTHFSVMDSDGNAVAMTVTLNMQYGSGVVTDKFGVALNNEMDDFTTQPNKPNAFGLIQGASNSIQPGKRPLSSMSPTLVRSQDKFIMALGGAGGPRIISGVLQSLYRVLVNGFDMDQAIQARRVHHQFLPQKIFVDPIVFGKEAIESLKKMNHSVEEGEIGHIMGVRLNKKGLLEGAFDSRGEGYASGF